MEKWKKWKPSEKTRILCRKRGNRGWPSAAHAVYIVDVNAIASRGRLLVGRMHSAHNWMGFAWTGWGCSRNNELTFALIP